MEEGYERKSGKEIKNFFRTSKVSAGEARGRYKRLKKLLSQQTLNKRVQVLNEIRAILASLIEKWEYLFLLSSLDSLLKKMFILTKKGLTLIELVIAIVMFVVLVGVTTYVFHAVLLSWSSQETRAGIDIGLDRGIEEVVRDLREARNVNSLNNDEIRFTQDQINFYIYYLYNGNDSYPPAFAQGSYKLKKAAVSGGMSGTFTYGDGQIIVTDVLPPPASDLSLSGAIITIDLSVKRCDETIRSRTRVRARNL